MHASPINYFGPSGSAHTVKIAMNFTGIAYGVVVSQMFPLMEKMGIDTKNLFDIMKEGSHGSGHFRIYGKKCVEKDYHLAFALELALKDLVYMKRLYEKPGFHVVKSVKLQNLDCSPTIGTKTGFLNQNYLNIQPK